MIRVLVAEESLAQRAHLVQTLEADGDIEVVGQTDSAADVTALAVSLQPDVITLDLQLSGGGGQQAIEQVMAFKPTPILVLSGAIVGRDSAGAVEALIAGALDILPKPKVWDTVTERTLRERIRVLRGATVLRHPRGGHAARAAAANAHRQVGVPIVAIAASTGGPAALAVVLGDLPRVGAAVLVVQHLHPDFVDGLVAWMARVSALPVELASDGAALRPDVVLIAPGGTHLKVGHDDTVVLDPEPATLHRPSADALFMSLEPRARSTVAVLLTGMGDDGAAGMLTLRRNGAATIVQDEVTSAVFGMPGAANKLGAAELKLPLDGIAGAIAAAVKR